MKVDTNNLKIAVDTELTLHAPLLFKYTID